ncbi:glycosyltransferase family 4 protein [Vibrio cholerae]|uniref:glycosyltransferase family 4 protein n=1 Tax=Vibrio cholerae TaxID=666 RepID=UPI002068F40E|nr:glycosyltransferase family 4 protein [Vibrio cholerae]EGR4059736.1 glycosyltransferase family 4 protein [Vibrio cholerae]EGR4418281.1 glycosyltransferase family 4 protein [Vibrio cholerae]MDW4531401.1 glycosyltransferase family 4 protein [Vibrio cholerae]BCN19386.1 putative glycosyltransferase [Vibrio cholerae]GIC07570.1 Glycosyltransferase [Vibrio cholerae]
MTRICFFCGNISWSGGTERVSTMIANELVKHGYSVSFISLFGASSPHFALDSKIECMSLFKTKRPFKLILPNVALRLRKLLKEKKVNVLIDVDTILSLYSIPAKFGLDIEHISWEHFNYKSDFKMPTRKLARILAAKFSNAVVTLTKKDKDYWKNAIDCNAKIVSIPNPTPFSYMENNIFEREKIVVAIGRLTEQKGFDLLLKIWSNVEKTGSEWKLYIIGDGEDKSKLEDLINRLSLKNAQIKPFTKDVGKYYSSASIYTMTSRFEGFPMVLLEAASYGLPIISFDCDTGPDELIINQETGILVKSNDLEEYSSQLIQLMNNEKLRFEMERKTIIEIKNYDVSNISRSWINLIESFNRS